MGLVCSSDFRHYMPQVIDQFPMDCNWQFLVCSLCKPQWAQLIFHDAANLTLPTKVLGLTGPLVLFEFLHQVRDRDYFGVPLHQMIKLQAFLFPFLQLQLLLLHALVPVQVILDDHLLHQLKQCRLLGTQDGHSVDKAPELFWLMQFTHNLCVHACAWFWRVCM
jgi:hypothetical protein